LTTMLPGKQTDFWIGLNDFHIEGTFFWTDSSPVKYTNWNENQTLQDDLQDCVYMTQAGRNTGRWDNVRCDETRGFICETSTLTEEDEVQKFPVALFQL